ncbi:MAG: PAS domain S-box protein, partial [Bacteroidota bacterium]|nr:PAS domain S-box protein [Bacteroidota bacterium]
MKKSTGKPENDPLHQKAEGLLKNSMENDSPQGNDEFAGFNETLLLSLPYPAMYVRRRDRVIVAANKIAIELGARIGRHCWREFGKSNHISPEDRETALNYPDLVPPELHIKCSFCRGDDCFSDSPNQNNPELHAFGRIWDSYWIKASEDVFLHYLIDITEHKQLVDSLRKSEIYLKQTQQIARLGTYTHDITTGIWVCSEILNQIFGIDAGYTKTVESWASIIHPDWRQRMTDYFTNEVVGNKKRFDKEYKIIRQNDGAERWVHGLGDLQFDDQNQPVQMIGTIRDITERKQKEEERKFLIAAVENTDSIIAVKDLDLRIVAANQAFANACGFTSIESLIGKTDAEVYGIPPQSEPVRTYMEDERKAQQLKPGEYILREEPLILPDGKTITILTRKYPIYDSEGNLFCTGSVSTNITERKEADKALWLKNIIFDTSIAANSIAGLDWKVTDANEAFLHDMGYQHKEEVIGKPVSHFLLHGFEADALTTALEDTGQWEGNFTAKRGDGSTFMAHALTTVLQDKNGKKTGYQASIIDITDLKETEEALREKEQMLQTVLDHFPGVVFWKDRESKYLGCNQAFASGVGLSNPAEIVGKTDFDLPWSETGAENYRAVDSEVMESGQKKLHIVERKNLLDGDGKLI